MLYLNLYINFFLLNFFIKILKRMGIFTKSRVLQFIFALLVSSVFAQVNLPYNFSKSSGTYTPITGGTALTTWTTASSTSVPIPSFTFNGAAYTQIYVSPHGGSISFGSTSPGTSVNLLSATGTYAGAVAALGGTTVVSTVAGSVPSVRWQDITASSEFVIQWTDVARTGQPTTDQFDYQIRLNYATNTINIVYGTFVFGTGISTTAMAVGLRGAYLATNPSYFTRGVLTTSTTPGVTNDNWNNSSSGSSSTTCRLAGPSVTTAPNVFPASGTTYTFTRQSTACSPLAVVGATTYFEGFEGINANNAYPNCTMAQASSTSFRTTTYTAAQAAYNRSARTGNGFLSFYTVQLQQIDLYQHLCN